MHVILQIYNGIHVRIINCRFMAIIFNVLILMRPTSITAYQWKFNTPSFRNIAFRFSMLKLFYVDDCRSICWVNLKSNQSRQCWQICWSVAILMQPMHYLSRNRTAVSMQDWCFAHGSLAAFQADFNVQWSV